MIPDEEIISSDVLFVNTLCLIFTTFPRFNVNFFVKIEWLAQHSETHFVLGLRVHNAAPPLQRTFSAVS
jgi:hypothetical protein